MNGTRLQVTAVLLFTFAFGLRVLLIIRNNFDGLYGQDSYAYFDAAVSIVKSVARGQPLAPFFWPIGYPASVALAFGFVGTGPLAGQLVSIITGSLIAPISFLITHEIIGQATSTIPGLPTLLTRDAAAISTGLVTAIGGQLVQSSIVVMSDAAALFWATLSAYAFLRYLRAYKYRLLVLAAAALAMATMTRWVYAALAPVWVILLVADHVRTHRTRELVLPLALSGLAGFLVLLPQLVLSATNPAPVLGHSWLVGWNPLNVFARTFDNVDGHFEYGMPVGIFYAQPAFHPSYISPILTIFLLVGAAVVARRAVSNPATAILLFGWIGVQYGFVAGIPYENIRFGLAYLPPLAILVGIGIHSLVALTGTLRVQSQLAPLSVLAVVSAGLVWNLIWFRIPTRVIFEIKREELQIIDELRARVPPDAQVVTFGPTLAIAHYTTFRTVALDEQTPNSLGTLANRTTSTYLLIDVSNIETQWRGQTPAVNFDILHSLFAPRRLAQIGEYTLFALDTH